MRTLIQALSICPSISPTRISEPYRLDMGGTNRDKEYDPFFDFDHCEMENERLRALEDVEKRGRGPVTEEEARWPESRVLSLLSFTKRHGTLRCEKEFAKRLMAWYIASAGTRTVTVRAINFALDILDNPVNFGYGTKVLENALITKAIGDAVRECHGCYSEIPCLSAFLQKNLRELLTGHHNKGAWEIASDIIETICAGNDHSATETITDLLNLYKDGKTKRDSGRVGGYLDPQDLWTAAEIGYLEQALVVLQSVHNAQAI